jgi:hypothetical protein
MKAFTVPVYQCIRTVCQYQAASGEFSLDSVLILPKSDRISSFDTTRCMKARHCRQQTSVTDIKAPVRGPCNAPPSQDGAAELGRKGSLPHARAAAGPVTIASKCPL